MSSESPPEPDLGSGSLLTRLFSISSKEKLDLLAEMQGLTGDGAAILVEEPASAATAQPGDLLFTILYEGRVRMAYISRVDIGGEEERGGSGTDESTDASEDDAWGFISTDAKYEEEGAARQERGSISKEVENEEEQSEQSACSSDTLTEAEDEEKSSTNEELKEKNRRLQIRVWQEYCVLVLFEGECWKVTKQLPIQWLQEDQIQNIQQRIVIENRRTDVDMTSNLECSKAVEDFINTELNPNIIDYNITKVLGTGASCKVYGADNQNAIKRMELTKKFDDRDALANKEPREVIILSSFRCSVVVGFFQAWTATGFYKSYLEGSSDSSRGLDDKNSESDNELDDQDSESDDELEDEELELRYVAVQMEYCGRPLSEFLDAKNCEMDVAKAWLIFEEIVKAVQFIHRSGVIHRDLKPKNIFFGYAGKLNKNW